MSAEKSKEIERLMNEVISGNLTEEEKNLKKEEVFKMVRALMSERSVIEPVHTTDGLLTYSLFTDDNGDNVPYVNVAERMKINAKRSPEDWVAPVQPGFERRDYPIYESLLALKATGHWDPSKG